MGDLVLVEDQVNPGMSVALDNGLEVTHMAGEEPRVLFLHYWGVGPVEALARGLRAALDQTHALRRQP